MKAEVEKQVEVLAGLVKSQPWPGRNGARNCRVLVALLKRVWTKGSSSLTIKTDLWSLVADSGLGRYQAVKESLRELEEQGWLKFTLGEPRHYSAKDVWQPGIQSVITLLPRESDKDYQVKYLPDPRLSLYDYGQAGSAGYLIICSLLDCDPKPYSVADISKKTGLNTRTIYRTMPKLLAHFRIVNEGYLPVDLEDACAHGSYDEERSNKLRAKLMARREAEAIVAAVEAEVVQEAVALVAAPLPAEVVTEPLGNTQALIRRMESYGQKMGQ